MHQLKIILASVLLLSASHAQAADLTAKLTAAFTRVFGEAAHDFKDIAIDDSAVAEVRKLSGWRYCPLSRV